MRKSAWNEAAAELRCDVCGRLPEPTKGRQTLASLAAVLPIEALVHFLVMQAELPFALKIAVLAVTTTVLVLWVAEPSAKRLLRSWLHAPAIHRRRRLTESPTLWRARTVLDDRPGALEQVTRVLARLRVNILTIHVHTVSDGVLDEFVLSAPEDVSDSDLVGALRAAGGRGARVWPTTALALADGQTKIIGLAVRVARNPDELPWAAAELLSAQVVEDRDKWSALRDGHGDGTVLKLPSAWHGPIVLARPGEPFTLAESARVHRLAELAEAIELAATGGPETR